MKKAATLPTYFESNDGEFRLLHGDSLTVLERLPKESVDLVFADPPYFLSNGGVTCQSGKMTSVHKGKWDISQGIQEDFDFHRRWLSQCQRVLKPNGTLWVSGTRHVIFSIGFAMQALGFKLLNDIVWYKRNPPPNLSCRYFTHSTETIIWAARDHRSRHVFNYGLMKEQNDGKQMKSLWNILPPRKEEKALGRHPTQKPLELLRRIILSSSKEGDLVLDPFSGSGTTGIACRELGRRFVGIELDENYAQLTVKRFQQAERALLMPDQSTSNGTRDNWDGAMGSSPSSRMAATTSPAG